MGLTQVKLSMRKMYSGHNKTVEVVRKECDSTGGLIDKVKVFHLMIRRGAYDGMKLVFEDDGNETVRSLLPTPPISTMGASGTK